MKRIKLFTWLMLLPVLSFTLSAGETNQTQRLLTKELKKGEAIIWYLYHSGWAVKTQNHLLIFDYWEDGEKPEQRSLNNGFINLDEISSQKVYVFVSHSHADHFDPVILEWNKSQANIKYIFGWKANENPGDIYFGAEREVREIDDLKIYNIHHQFDYVPESAFLVLVDGLAIIHSGDHGHGKGPLNPIFKENIDYLAEVSKGVDLLFIPTFGGEFYVIEKLAPKVVFPMHDGGTEHQYKKFALKAAAMGVKAKVSAAEKRGDCFLYSKGKIKKQK